MPLTSGKFCYVIVPGNPVETCIGAVVYKESGYYASTYNDRNNMKDARDLVDLINGRLGVSRSVEDAMLYGSMFGWHVPAAQAAHDHFETKEGIR